MNIRFFKVICGVVLTIALVGQASASLISVEFSQDDQVGFDLWPTPISGSVSTAAFTTDSILTSGTTTVTLEASSHLYRENNRGSTNGTPAGYSYQNLYEDLLFAPGPNESISIAFSGLNASQMYKFTLFAWDPRSTNSSDKVWTVTEGTSGTLTQSVNYLDPLVDNNSFAMEFMITTSATGTFGVRNTAGLPQSGINGFILEQAPATLVPEPTTASILFLGLLSAAFARKRRTH